MSTDQPIVDAIQLSHQILKAVEAGETDTIESLEISRLGLIKTYFNAGHAINAEKAIELKQLNDQIVEKLTELKKQTQIKLNKFKQAGKASKAYQSVALK